MVNVGDESVEFLFFRPGAGQVHLTGDFNGWQFDTPMVPGRDGYWRARMELPVQLRENIDEFTERTWLLPEVLDWCERPAA